MTLTEYRKRHRRCRTCKYACDSGLYHSLCKAKNKRCSVRVEESGLRGMFCKIYKPKEDAE